MSESEIVYKTLSRSRKRIEIATQVEVEKCLESIILNKKKVWHGGGHFYLRKGGKKVLHLNSYIEGMGTLAYLPRQLHNQDQDKQDTTRN